MVLADFQPKVPEKYKMLSSNGGNLHLVQSCDH
jgi:hypothetical protein